VAKSLILMDNMLFEQIKNSTAKVFYLSQARVWKAADFFVFRII
jgi:hypothetical protein